MSDTPISTPGAVSEQPPAPSQANTNVADPKLDLYVRKERELAKKRKEFDDYMKAEKGKWDAERSQYVPKKLFKDDPFKAVSEVDLDYDKLTETLMSQPNINDPTIKALHAQIQEMRQEFATRDQKAQEAEKLRAEQEKSSRLEEVKEATKASEDFDLIERFEAHEAVLSHIEEVFQRDGIQLSMGEACKAIEDQLFSLAKKITESKKLAPAPAAQQEQKLAEETQAKRTWKNPQGHKVVDHAQFNTISHRMSQEAPAQPSKELDRRARAIAIARGEKF